MEEGLRVNGTHTELLGGERTTYTCLFHVRNMTEQSFFSNGIQGERFKGSFEMVQTLRELVDLNSTDPTMYCTLS